MKKWKKGEDGWDDALQDLAHRYKGLGGGPDSESSVHASKQDIKEGYAWFWSDNSDVSNLIQRSNLVHSTFRESTSGYNCPAHGVEAVQRTPQLVKYRAVDIPSVPFDLDHFSD